MIPMDRGTPSCEDVNSSARVWHLAFPNRDMLFTLGTHSIWPDKDGVEDNTAKLRANWQELQPLTKGFYTNYVRLNASVPPKIG